MNLFMQFLYFLKNKFSTILLWIGFIFFIETFSFYFISQEKYIYVWDYATYYLPFRTLDNLAKTGTTNFINTIIDSLSSDYNLLGSVFLVPFRILFGQSRIVYIISTITFYTIPSILLFTYMVKKNVSFLTNNIVLISFVSVLTLLLNPFFFAGVYLGYIDVFGFGIICFIYGYYFLHKDDVSFIEHILLGFLLSFLLFFRRAFGFWIASFMITFFSFQAFEIYHQRKMNLLYISTLLSKLALTLGVFLGLLFVVAEPFAHRALFENYADIYSAFKDNPVFSFINSFYSKSGPIPILLFIVGIIIAGKSKNLRRFSLFLMVQAILTFLLFIRVQSIMEQYLYYFYPAFLYFIFISLIYPFTKIKRNVITMRIGIMALVFISINFFIFFVPSRIILPGYLSILLPSEKHYPLIRTDFDQLEMLIRTLSTLNSNKYGNIYIFSISNDFNSDIVRTFCQTNTNYKNTCSRILRTNDIDKRDGFPLQIFNAQYIVLSDTKPFYVTERQHIVDDLMNDFLNGGILSKNFTKLPYTFTFINNIRVYLYEKNSTIPDETINAVSDNYQRYFPNNNLFNFSANTITQ